MADPTEIDRATKVAESLIDLFGDTEMSQRKLGVDFSEQKCKC